VSLRWSEPDQLLRWRTRERSRQLLRRGL
jgi:hypothetical protein